MRSYKCIWHLEDEMSRFQIINRSFSLYDKLITLIFVYYTESFITFFRWGLTLGAPLYQPAGGYFDDCAKVHSNNNDSIQSTLVIIMIPGALFQLMLLSGPRLLILVRGLACPKITRQPSGAFMVFLRVFSLLMRLHYFIIACMIIIILLRKKSHFQQDGGCGWARMWSLHFLQGFIN